MTSSDNFKPGIYKHHKRPGNYIALHLATHHDSDELFVVYICGDTGRVRLREWATPGKDSWSDIVDQGEGVSSPRFIYVGPFT